MTPSSNSSKPETEQPSAAAHIKSCPFCNKSHSMNDCRKFVAKESAITPLSVVFNASSKQNGGQSHNECLYAGPALVEVLFDLLLRFRSKPYAVTANISKAFRCLLLDPKDAKYAHFLWPENSSNITTFEFKVVASGVNLSPYLLQPVLQAHLQRRIEMIS
ncbi:uncharacterized protein [Macrobrachium rosenbergii]|uniref:uncharacterized protein n=1 Tax=Macrobrachium rosenbergii TaxID=79674 RepID=UPI0034D51FC6